MPGGSSLEISRWWFNKGGCVNCNDNHTFENANVKFFLWRRFFETNVTGQELVLPVWCHHFCLFSNPFFLLLPFLMRSTSYCYVSLTHVPLTTCQSSAVANSVIIVVMCRGDYLAVKASNCWSWRGWLTVGKPIHRKQARKKKKPKPFIRASCLLHHAVLKLFFFFYQPTPIYAHRSIMSRRWGN